MSIYFILELWRYHEISNLLDVSGSALLVYDYMLTFSSEVEFVWKKPFTLVTLVFAITRYLPFIDNSIGILYSLEPHIPFSVCVLSSRFQFLSYIMGICIAEIVLILRTMAIWHGNKRIGIFLGMLLTGFALPILYYAINYLGNFIKPIYDPSTKSVYDPSNPVLAEYISKLPACVVPSTSKDPLHTSYVLFMVFESVVLLLTLSRARAYRAESSKLSRTIFLDSISFYVLILVLSIINVTVALPGLSRILSILHRNIHSIVTGRIILDIRRAVYESNESGVLSASSLIFGDRLTTSISSQSQE